MPGMISIEEGKASEAVERLEKSGEIYTKVLGYNAGGVYLMRAYRLVGRSEDAIKFADKELENSSSLMIGVDYFGFSFVQAILAALENNDLGKANKFQQMFEKNISDNIDLGYMLDLSRALILKTEKTGSSIFKAQGILREIVALPGLWYHPKVLALKHLCEILIIEYELFEEEKTLREIEEILNDLDNIAKDQNLLRLRFENGLLQSKLQILFGNIGESKKILIELEELGNENELEYYLDLVKNELKILEENFQKWHNLVENNASMKEIIQETKIKEYFIQAKEISKELN